MSRAKPQAARSTGSISQTSGGKAGKNRRQANVEAAASAAAENTVAEAAPPASSSSSDEEGSQSGSAANIAQASRTFNQDELLKSQPG